MDATAELKVNALWGEHILFCATNPAVTLDMTQWMIRTSADLHEITDKLTKDDCRNVMVEVWAGLRTAQVKWKTPFPGLVTLANAIERELFPDGVQAH